MLRAEVLKNSSWKGEISNGYTYTYIFSLNEPAFSSTFLPTIAAIIRTYVNPLKVKRLLEDQKHRLCTNLLMVFVYIFLFLEKYIIII